MLLFSNPVCTFYIPSLFHAFINYIISVLILQLCVMFIFLQWHPLMIHKFIIEKILNIQTWNTMWLIIIFKDLFTFILCVWVFCLCGYLCVTCIQCAQRPEEGFGAPGTGVTDVVSHRESAGNHALFLSRLASALKCWAISPDPE